jgi:hypothetical protein
MDRRIYFFVLPPQKIIIIIGNIFFLTKNKKMNMMNNNNFFYYYYSNNNYPIFNYTENKVEPIKSKIDFILNKENIKSNDNKPKDKKTKDKPPYLFHYENYYKNLNFVQLQNFYSPKDDSIYKRYTILNNIQNIITTSRNTMNLWGKTNIPLLKCSNSRSSPYYITMKHLNLSKLRTTKLFIEIFKIQKNRTFKVNNNNKNPIFKYSKLNGVEITTDRVNESINYKNRQVRIVESTFKFKIKFPKITRLLSNLTEEPLLRFGGCKNFKGLRLFLLKFMLKDLNGEIISFSNFIFKNDSTTWNFQMKIPYLPIINYNYIYSLK